MWNIIRLIIDKLIGYESNVTDFEKMENSYRLSRKKTFWLVIIEFFYLVYIFVSSYFLLVLIPENYIVLFFGVGVAVLIYFHTYKYQTLTYQIYLPMLHGLFFGTFFFWPLFEFVWYKIILLVVSLPMLVFLLYSVYLSLRKGLTKYRKYKLKFFISDAEYIDATLISITPRGDYIIEGDSPGEEVLLMRNSIKRIVYRKSDNKE